MSHCPFPFLLFLLLSFAIKAQDGVVKTHLQERETQQISFFDYLKRDSIVEMTMISDFTTIRENKYHEEYFDGQLSFVSINDSIQRFPVAFRTRGKSRKRLCYYPALKLKISKDDLVKRGFSSDNKFKMVCQCNAGKKYEQALLREYLAYRIHNLISPYSFRVHLLSVNYIDTQSKQEEKRFAFFMESEASLAERVAGRIIERNEWESGQLSREFTIQMALFQYLIANTDWNVLGMHNVIVLLDENKKIVPVSYDYDYSGLVNTLYATPNPDYPVEKVTDRYFLSSDFTALEINEQLVRFHQQKEAILALVNDFDLLSNRSRRFINRFIRDFYKTIENPKKLKRELLR